MARRYEIAKKAEEAKKTKRKSVAKTKRTSVVVKKAAKKAKKTKAQKKTSRTVSAHAPASPGAVVTGTDPCVCGDSPEEHGHDPKHPGSTACRNCGTCIAYEADLTDTEE